MVMFNMLLMNQTQKLLCLQNPKKDFLDLFQFAKVETIIIDRYKGFSEFFQVVIKNNISY